MMSSQEEADSENSFKILNLDSPGKLGRVETTMSEQLLSHVPQHIYAQTQPNDLDDQEDIALDLHQGQTRSSQSLDGFDDINNEQNYFTSIFSVKEALTQIQQNNTSKDKTDSSPVILQNFNNTDRDNTSAQSLPKLIRQNTSEQNDFCMMTQSGKPPCLKEFNLSVGDQSSLLDYSNLLQQIQDIDKVSDTQYQHTPQNSDELSNQSPLKDDRQTTHSICKSHFVRKESLSLSDISCNEHEKQVGSNDKGGGFLQFLRRRLSPKPQKYKACLDDIEDDDRKLSEIKPLENICQNNCTQTDLTWDGRKFVSTNDQFQIDCKQICDGVQNECRLSRQGAFKKLKQLRQQKRAMESSVIPTAAVDRIEKQRIYVSQVQRRSLDWSHVEARTHCRLEEQFIPRNQGQTIKSWKQTVNSDTGIKIGGEYQQIQDGNTLEELLHQVNHLLSNVKDLLVKEF